METALRLLLAAACFTTLLAETDLGGHCASASWGISTGNKIESDTKIVHIRGEHGWVNVRDLLIIPNCDIVGVDVMFCEADRVTFPHGFPEDAHIHVKLYKWFRWYEGTLKNYIYCA